MKKSLQKQEAVIISAAKAIKKRLEEVDAALATIEREHLYKAVNCQSMQQYHEENDDRLGLSKWDYARDLHGRRNAAFVNKTGKRFKTAKASILAARCKKKMRDFSKHDEFDRRLAESVSGNEIAETDVRRFVSFVSAEYGIVGEGDEYPTPDWLFKPLNDVFHFDVDVAASNHLYKVKPYYTIDEHGGGLTKDWQQFDAVWCNPPFSNVEPWVRKAYETALTGTDVVVLTQVATETNWFQSYYWAADLMFVDDRVDFSGGNNRFGTMIGFFHLRKLSDDEKEILGRLPLSERKLKGNRFQSMGIGMFYDAIVPLYEVALDSGDYVNPNGKPINRRAFERELGWA